MIYRKSAQIDTTWGQGPPVTVFILVWWAQWGDTAPILNSRAPKVKTRTREIQEPCGTQLGILIGPPDKVMYPSTHLPFIPPSHQTLT